MPVGIISNTAALRAHSNLYRAESETRASVARLSSGSRIDKASTDVAGLAIGTILQTNISTLKASLTNTAQANSLLGVTDGALENISSILQRQKALAAQSTSGSLSTAARSFLDAEFQKLSQEIDRISETTNFNGITLIDGSLYSPSKLEFATSNSSVRAEGVVEFADVLADTETLTLNIHGTNVVFTGRASANMSVGTPELNLDIGDYGTVAAQAERLNDMIDTILSYTGTTAAVLEAKAALSAIETEYNTTDAFIKFTALSAGIEGGAIGVDTSAGAAHITLDGVDVNGGAQTFQSSGVVGVDNDLKGGTFATAGAAAYAGTATTVAQGSRGDTIITAIDTTAAGAGAGNATGVSTAGVSNNPDFVGVLQGFTAEFTDFDRVNIELKVGNYNYRANAVDTTPGAATIVRLFSVEDGGGFFDIQLETAANSGQTSVENQDDADEYAVRLNKAIENVVFYQNRQIKSYTSAGTIFPTGSTIASGNLAGSSFNFINHDFENVQVEKVAVKAPVVGATDAEIEITVNGEVYRSGFNNVGTAAALTTTINANTTIGLVNVDNPLSILQFTTGGTAINITNDAQSEGLQKALEDAFKIKTGNAGGLTFQVGTTASDIINVEIESTKTEDIYLDENLIFTNLSITTSSEAGYAENVIDYAIGKVISIRANIGALQSRFGYAASNIESSIQNQDAARAVFLDTDVASESTDFAQAQVRMNASISVLTQANQMPQNLLKLIG